ncbi:MAG: prolyl oligopeptidase family serine peptidase, partial [Thermodesulfobacteriota bacterium]
AHELSLRYLVARPYGRANTGDRGLGERDVFDVIEEMKHHYDIDPRRIYLTGFSMGGSGTWRLGLNNPDRFAAIAPGGGGTDYRIWRDESDLSLKPWARYLLESESPLWLAENALNLPVYCYHGARDRVVFPQHSRRMISALWQSGYDPIYDEYPEHGHGGFPPQLQEKMNRWFSQHQLDPWPQKVIFNTYELGHNKAYWVKINTFLESGRPARIEAEVENLKDEVRIKLKTDNVGSVSLDLSGPIFTAVKRLSLEVNGHLQRLSEHPKEFTLTLSDRGVPMQKKAQPSKFSKNSLVHGPIDDVFGDSFLFVYGTIGRDVLRTAANKAAAVATQQGITGCDGGQIFHVIPDTEVTTKEIADYHLILFGGPESNVLTARIINQLPVKIDAKGISVAGQRYAKKDVGLAMVYPNPLNPKRYILLFAGNSSQALNDLDKLPRPQPDYVIFNEATKQEGGKYLQAGFFDSNWEL